MSNLLYTKGLKILSVVLALVSALWYISSLRASIKEKDTEIAGLAFTVSEVVKIAERTAEQLVATKADHKVQLSVLEESLHKYTVQLIEAEKIKSRIRYVKTEDDGPVSTVLTDTIRMLSEASSSNRPQDITGTNP